MRFKIGVILLIFVIVILACESTFAGEAAIKRKNLFGHDNDVTSRIETALGYDSNVYLTPNAAYIDYAVNGVPLVTPMAQASYFKEILANLGYQGVLSPWAINCIDYRFKGRYYLESESSNANEYDSRIKAGIRLRASPSESVKKDFFYLGVFYGVHKKLYIDRDDGTSQNAGVDGDVNIADRYRYENVGTVAEYEKKSGKVNYGFDVKFEQRDYEDPPAALTIAKAYDYDLYAFGGKIQYPLSDVLKLKLKYKYTDKDYDVRNSRNLLGNLDDTLPKRHYKYNSFGASLRCRLPKAVIIYLDYNRKIRKDKAVGYDDYTKDRLGFRVIFKPFKALRLKLGGTYWQRDYDIAYAFNNPGSLIDDPGNPGAFILDPDNPGPGPGPVAKEYDGYDAEFKIDYNLSKSWTLFAEGEYEQQNTTDKRYEYDRYQMLAGVKFTYGW